MMCNPFKVGDKIHNVWHGRGKVIEIATSDILLRVDFGGLGVKWVGVGTTSFSPWPAPDHVRPFEPTLKQGDVLVALSNNLNTAFRLVVEYETPDSVTSTSAIFLKNGYSFYRTSDQLKFN